MENNNIMVLKHALTSIRDNYFIISIGVEEYKFSPNIIGFIKSDFKIVNRAGETLYFDFKETKDESYHFSLNSSNAAYVILNRQGFQMDKIELNKL